MPRRRTIKARMGKRAKPKAPEGDEGAHLEGETKKTKLEVLLKDLDEEVECRVAEIAVYYDDLVSRIQKMYQMELMKVPMSVRSMKMSEALNSETSKRPGNSQQIEDLINSVKTRPKRKAAASQLETIDENRNLTMDAQATNYKKTRGKPLPQTTRRTRNTKASAASITTPFNPRMNTGWETPLQTPAFDPRLPCTPAVPGTVRKLRPGERTMYMLVSEHGSPISDNKKGTLCISSAPLNGTDLTEMDDDTLMEFQKSIGNILTMRKVLK